MDPNKENTPFVIDLKQQKQTNYGSATSSTDSSSNIYTGAANAKSPTDSPTTAALNNNNNARRSTLPAGPSYVYCLHGRDNVVVRDHCHRQRFEGIDVKARKKLIIASVLCLLFMICEIIGGVLSNSLAIATDAAHLLTDFASFMISLFAIWLAGRPSTQRMSFGWYRAEVIGAMASVVMIWVITAILVWLAVQRLINGNFEVDAKIMLITSGLAILVNLVMGLQLQHGHTHGLSGGAGHSHGETKAKKSEKKKQQKSQQAITDINLTQTTIKDSDKQTVEAPKSNSNVLAHLEGGVITACSAAPTAALNRCNELPPALSYQNTTHSAEVVSMESNHQHAHGAGDGVNLNVRAALIHVIGDALQSVGVFLAALLIYFNPSWAIADPICTFIFSIIVLFTTFGIMKDALLVLMEGTPNYMHYTEVLEVFKQIEGVERVHNLRIWALSINKVALSAHLAVGPGANQKQILEQATTAVHLRFNFFETTIQIEDFTPEMENCEQCSVPDK